MKEGYCDEISFDEFIDILTEGKGNQIKKELREIEKQEKEKTFVIGDLHLDHSNIIKYCNRPFSSVGEMNKTIINNWNKTIKENDVVYFLGDLSFGKGSQNADYWLQKLNGKITVIRGNHDKSKKIKFLDNFVLKYKDHQFLLTHNPLNVSKQWNGWIIHGHCHNNNLKNCPFINGKMKTINVGVEVIGYKPLELDQLFKLNFENIERMETINSKPIFKRR
ncbi:MAG: metallophosphoesterase [Candidatus Woesearchaeota archaeon]